jgi:hypothetical protein
VAMLSPVQDLGTAYFSCPNIEPGLWVMSGINLEGEGGRTDEF